MKKHIIYILIIGTAIVIQGCYASLDPVVVPYEYNYINEVPRRYRHIIHKRPIYYRPYRYRYRTHHRHYTPRIRRTYVIRHNHRYPRVQPRPRTYKRPKPKLKKRTVRRHYDKKGNLRKRVIRRRYR